MPERYKKGNIFCTFSLHIAGFGTRGEASLYKLCYVSSPGNEFIVYVILLFTLASLTFIVIIYIKEILNFSLGHVVMKILMKFREQ